MNYTLWGKPQEDRALLNEHQCGLDPYRDRQREMAYG